MEEKKCPILPADDAVQNWFEENIDKECSASSAIYKFRLWLESFQRKAITGATWVRASERLPVKCGKENTVVVRGMWAGKWPFVVYGYRNFNEEDPRMYFEVGSKSDCTNEVEWLDESGTAAGREEGFTEADANFMRECDLYPTSDGVTIITENDEGASIDQADIIKLADILKKYADSFKQKEK